MMRQLNAAYLTKLAWRMTNEPSALWVRTLRDKYCRGQGDLQSISAQPNASPTWNGIVENLPLLHKGIGKAGADGRNTMFWKHSWVGPHSLLTHTTRPIPLDQQSDTVAQYWDQNTGWRWDLFSDYLPPALLEQISSFELFREENINDTIYWQGDPSGVYRIKSAISLLQNIQAPSADESWTWIWKIKDPYSCKVLLWLAPHDRLLTNAVREKRGLTNDSLCPLCEHEYEDAEHVLRRCPDAQQIWSVFFNK